MPERFFALSTTDQQEVLELARERTGRPAHLLEKDVWVVWTLNALFESSHAADLTFKGGTSLSKAYTIIDRFSEDLDLTYDIRKLIPELVRNESGLPPSRSQAKKWTDAVHERLPNWIRETVRPLLAAALKREHVSATLEVSATSIETLRLHYPALRRGTGYVAPVVTLEFGARSTGEPHQAIPIVCDMDGQIEGVTFPKATPQVMRVARTFWEKATAAHVYCAQARLRGDRYARHWHDLAAIARSPHFADAIADRTVASAVAEHKSRFFIEKDCAGQVIDYLAAAAGKLQIVPKGDALKELAADYARMIADDVMVRDAVPFDELMRRCADVAHAANAASVP